MSHREPKGQPKEARDRACEPEQNRKSWRVISREPEHQLEVLNMSLRVTLGADLVCQSQTRQ